jgi:hypothetical protein
MANFYEVPVHLEIDEETMCVYIKVYSNSESEAAIKAVDIVTANVEIYSDEADIVKV